MKQSNSPRSIRPHQHRVSSTLDTGGDTHYTFSSTLDTGGPGWDAQKSRKGGPNKTVFVLLCTQSAVHYALYVAGPRIDLQLSSTNGGQKLGP